ncbi:auxin-induced protein AUX28-like [Momordica charantia]|uniref:Auxin-responsive protein n=1 Tax=Momordica charantia TaxID=3673 RepID=A0A6J1CVW1_MOMCH|nr:auxin-induced protein AUX28-like [Momordica charantia]
MSFEETELRLGLPGNIIIGSGDHQVARKRGFHETETETTTKMPHHHHHHLKLTISASKEESSFEPLDPAKPPPPKGEVVGWPPIRSHRKKRLGLKLKGSRSEDEIQISDEKKNIGSGSGSFVKVSLDGAPYLRKLDLAICTGYNHLSHALAKLFATSFTIGMKDFMNETKLIDLLNASDYVPTYQDKDGDWMLVGDVPWQMFVESCKRLRIMKGKEAIGLAPRAVEKCNNYKS